jgi:hypothetical protein
MHWTNKISFTKFTTIPKQVEKQSPWNEVKTKKNPALILDVDV